MVEKILPYFPFPFSFSHFAIRTTGKLDFAQILYDFANHILCVRSRKFANLKYAGANEYFLIRWKIYLKVGRTFPKILTDHYCPLKSPWLDLVFSMNVSYYIFYFLQFSKINFEAVNILNVYDNKVLYILLLW